MVVYLAAITAMDKSIYEAAIIDGVANMAYHLAADEDYHHPYVHYGGGAHLLFRLRAVLPGSPGFQLPL
jgi:hypothetical protein